MVARKGRPKVLIADDDEIVVELLCDALGDDFRVETANDGGEAVRKAAKMRPDVVLVDAVMPKMNGYDACRALRQRPETADTPIIMVTGQSGPSQARRAFRAGVTDLVPKPFSVSQLRSRTRLWAMRGAHC
jgi:CheY-like chemotaxis protein